jgi:uncharacterized lipoprotein YmbA
MNTTFKPRTSAAGTRGPTQVGAGAALTRLAALICSVALCGGIIGCSFLKPAKATTRRFVLTPMVADGPASATGNTVPVGLGQVKVPTYLFDTSVAIRKGTNEIEYLPSMLWAERLDAGFQRVLAANLAILLPTDRVFLSDWQKDAVAAEVYVTIEQFDVDTSGRGVLIARWRMLSPGGETLLKAGKSNFSHQGPSLDAGASGVVATQSELVADLSVQLAQALQETTSRPASPAAK